MTERVIGQRRQADNRVIANQLAGLSLPDVARPARADTLRCVAEVTPLVETEVEAVNLVPGFAQERDHDGPNVATIARNENPHRQPPRCLETSGTQAVEQPPGHHRTCDIGPAMPGPDTCKSDLFIISSADGKQIAVTRLLSV